jgi:hypothetical protein
MDGPHRRMILFSIFNVQSDQLSKMVVDEIALRCGYD